MSERAQTQVKTFRTNSGEWCAEVYVWGSMLEVEYGPTSLAALEALWWKVDQASRIQDAGLAAVAREVYRADPWRGRRIVALFRARRKE